MLNWLLMYFQILKTNLQWLIFTILAYFFESIRLIVMEVIFVILFYNDLYCEHFSSCYKYLILIKICIKVCINGLICKIHINYKSVPFPIYSNIVIYFAIFDLPLDYKVDEPSSCESSYLLYMKWNFKILIL